MNFFYSPISLLFNLFSNVSILGKLFAKYSYKYLYSATPIGLFISFKASSAVNLCSSFILSIIVVIVVHSNFATSCHKIHILLIYIIKLI